MRNSKSKEHRPILCTSHQSTACKHMQPSKRVVAAGHSFSEISLLFCLLYMLRQHRTESQRNLIQPKYSVTVTLITKSTTVISREGFCTVQEQTQLTLRKNLKTRGTPHDGTNSKHVYTQNLHGDPKVKVMGRAKHLFPFNFPRGSNLSGFNPT